MFVDVRSGDTPVSAIRRCRLLSAIASAVLITAPIRHEWARRVSTPRLQHGARVGVHASERLREAGGVGRRLHQPHQKRQRQQGELAGGTRSHAHHHRQRVTHEHACLSPSRACVVCVAACPSSGRRSPAVLVKAGDAAVAAIAMHRGWSRADRVAGRASLASPPSQIRT